MLTCLALLCLCGNITAQAGAAVTMPKPAGTGNTYAVVVGISTYANTGIPQLEYAHKDALSFAVYLQSRAGGNVPQSNIRLLINDQATYAAIYDALDWLLNTCQKNDVVYFYFSGHGDMENTTIYKLGFLLAYNTPRTNYINNAVRIEDLNNIANTLSVKVNANVILITDACHSGKLAGTDYHGTYLVGDQLRTVQNKEIRITSCATDQLSAEDEGWGGGRGVFSYYLVNGLEGMADKNQDKLVSLDELKGYLDSALAADALLAQKAIKQNPVIKGNNGFLLANVDILSLAAVRKQAVPLLLKNMTPMVSSSPRPLPAQPQAYFFDLLKKRTPEELLDFNALDKLPKEQVPAACLQMLADSLQHAYGEQQKTDSTIAIDTLKMALLKRTLLQNSDALARFNNKLAVMLSDRAQDIINLYLQGDAAELERRNYYNSKSNGYDVYPKMLSVALKLTAATNYLAQILQVKLHYFSGVAARLKIPGVADPTALIALAFNEQQQAFALEENAAYIQNEMGVLYLLKNNPAAAEKKFIRATQIAPQWAIPFANLAGLYLSGKNNEKAAAAVQKALQLQPNLQIAHINSGIIEETKHHLLTAEERFQQSIRINSRHYLPFERLAYLYMNTTQYAAADSFFYEADKRKKGFHFKNDFKHYPPIAMAQVLAPNIPCAFDSADVGKADVMGHLIWALRAYESNNMLNAEKKLKEVIALDKTNPLAFHYLGRLLFFQKRWQEGAIIFNMAVSYYLSDSLFGRYCDSVSARLANTPSKNCIVMDFKSYYYTRVEDHYFSGRLYEYWHHYAEAEQHYKKVIELAEEGAGGYYLLWNLLERTGRFADAETALRSFALQRKGTGDRSLNDFYKRMLTRYPDAGEWLYKAGNFLYDLCLAEPDAYPVDKKKIAPDTQQETYLVGISNPAIPDVVVGPPEETETMPGIGEQVVFSASIIYPRSDGITYLRKADSLLLPDEDRRADINYKIGDMYVWQGLAERALLYYRTAADLRPDNANTRLNLVDIYNRLFQFSNAMEQLDSLYRRREIDFDKELLLAKYYIHQSRFEDAASLLRNVKAIHPYIVPAIIDLNGRLQWLSEKAKASLPYYKAYLTAVPNDHAAMYSIARVYATTGNTAEAWTWLEQAMANGFRYGWVLKYDDVWKAYRKQPKWAELQKHVSIKTYADDAR